LDVDIIFGCGDLGEIESDRRGGERPWGDVVVYGEKRERVEGDVKNGFRVLTDVFMRNWVVGGGWEEN